MNRTMSHVKTLLLTLSLLLTSSVYAATPSPSLGFQGQLYSGATPLSSSVNATFTFYDALTGGAITGSSIPKTITVVNGYFGTQFTPSDTTGVDFNQQLYIEVSINGTILSPRTTVNPTVSSLKTFGTFSYATPPAVGPSGNLYFNTTDNVLYISDGTAWSVTNPWVTTATSTSFMGGRVGIGTTAPGATLDVKGSIQSSAGIFYGVTDTVAQLSLVSYRNSQVTHVSFQGSAARGTQSNPLAIQSNDSLLRLHSGGWNGQQFTTVGGDYPAEISFLADGDFSSTVNMPGRISFYTLVDGGSYKSERMRITSGGNIGIGSINPTSKLTIAGSNTTSSTLRLESFRTAIVAGNVIAGIDFASNDSNLTTPGNTTASILAIANSTHTASQLGTDLAFNVTNGATTSEAMRILGNGNVGIGTSTPTAQLSNTGSVRFAALTGGGANLIVDSLGNVTVSSDERLKDIQGNFTTGLDQIKGLTPINYKWKPETGYDTQNSYTGFSAQNVQAHIPEAVSTDARGFLTLADRPILAALVNAVKELAVKVEAILAWFKVDNGQFCVDDVCMTKAEFKTMMINSKNNSGGGAPSNPPITPTLTTPAPDPVVDDTPAPTDEPTDVVDIPQDDPVVVPPQTPDTVVVPALDPVADTPIVTPTI